MEAGHEEEEAVAEPEDVDGVGLDVLDAADEEVLYVGFGVLENHEDETDGEKGDEGDDEPADVAASGAPAEGEGEGGEEGDGGVELGAEVKEIGADLFEKAGGEDGGECDAFVLPAGDGVHEAFPCAGVAPVDGGVLVGGEGHVEVEAEAEEDEHEGDADGASVGEEGYGEGGDEEGKGGPAPEAGVVGAGDPHPVGEGGGFGGDFVEADEKDEERSGDEKVAEKKAFADEEPADDHEQDAGDLKGEGEVVDADEGEEEAGENEGDAGEVGAGEHV